MKYLMKSKSFTESKTYIKTYETLVKHTSDLAMNHPLRSFSRKFEDVLILKNSSQLAANVGVVIL